MKKLYIKKGKNNFYLPTGFLKDATGLNDVSLIKTLSAKSLIIDNSNFGPV